MYFKLALIYYFYGGFYTLWPQENPCRNVKVMFSTIHFEQNKFNSLLNNNTTERQSKHKANEVAQTECNNSWQQASAKGPQSSSQAAAYGQKSKV